MKTRIITGSVCGALALLVMAFFPPLAMRFVLSAFCVVAMFELLAAESCKHKGVIIAAIVFAAVCPFLDMLDGFLLLWIVLIVYVLLLALMQLTAHHALPFEQITFVLCVSVMVVLPMSSMAYIYAIPVHGRVFMLYAMFIAWFSDIGAYFTGVFFGKHPLCKNISPKKTVEGFIGGILLAVLMSVLGAWAYQTYVLTALGQQINYWMIGLIALGLAPISVVGDLLCSVIKRYRNIKDFGNIFPGHGGVMDRFDSLIFVAPILFVFCQKLPLIQ